MQGFSDDALAITVKSADGSVRWPSFCPCCGSPPDSKTTIAFTRTVGYRPSLLGQSTVTNRTESFSIPYCQYCLDHSRKSMSLNVGCLVGGVIALAICITTLALLEGTRPTGAGVLLTLTFFVGVFSV